MKKQILSIALMTFLASSLVLTGCKKDEEEPVVTLTGGATQSFDLAEATDPGATVTDNKDDALTATSDFATVVKKNEVNTYTVTYTAEDEAGNIGKATKTVKVKSDKLAGAYDCTDIVSGASNPVNNGTFGYNLTITQSSTDYNKILLGNFGGFGSSVSAFATVTGTTVTIPAQALSVPGIGTVNISGTGQYDGANKKVTSINYTTDGFGNGSVTLTKQ
jgi:hypothetical protein